PLLSTLFPYTTLFRSSLTFASNPLFDPKGILWPRFSKCLKRQVCKLICVDREFPFPLNSFDSLMEKENWTKPEQTDVGRCILLIDRKSTRLNSKSPCN